MQNHECDFYKKEKRKGLKIHEIENWQFSFCVRRLKRNIENGANIISTTSINAKKRKTIKLKCSSTIALDELTPYINQMHPNAVILKCIKSYCEKPETHSFPKAICFIDPELYEHMNLKELIDVGT